MSAGTLQLMEQLAASQERLAKLEADALMPAPNSKAALAAASHTPGASASAGSDSLASSRARGVAPGVVYDAKGWYLHVCVALAALGVRWWLLHQTDPLQQKIMLVVVWPVSAEGGKRCCCPWWTTSLQRLSHLEGDECCSATTMCTALDDFVIKGAILPLFGKTFATARLHPASPVSSAMVWAHSQCLYSTSSQVH